MKVDVELIQMGEAIVCRCKASQSLSKTMELSLCHILAIPYWSLTTAF